MPSKKRPHKSKSDWRKHADVQDIEDALHEVRKQELQGGPVQSLPDASLFVIDKSGADMPALKKARKTLTIDRILAGNANVKSPVVRPQKKNPIGSDSSKIDSLVKNFDDHKRSQEQKLQMIETRRLPAELKPGLAQTVTDFWDNNKSSNIQPKIIKPKAAVVVPAVEVAHPGSSYNPEPSQHRALIQKVSEMEAAQVRKEKRKVSDAQIANKIIRRPALLNDMLPAEEEDDDEEVGSDDETEEANGTKKKQPERKTQAQRKKEMRHKRLMAKHKAAKRSRVRHDDLNRLKSLRKELDHDQMKHEQRVEQRQFNRDAAEAAPGRLGVHKFEQSRLLTEVKLTPGSGSLRALEQEGNLFKDRAQSMHKRNVVEPRVRVKRQKPRKTSFYNKRYDDLPDYMNPDV